MKKMHCTSTNEIEVTDEKRCKNNIGNRIHQGI
jgi:hypothetical protein